MPGLSQVSQKIQERVHQNVEKCRAAADNATVMLKDLCCQIQVIPPYMTDSVHIAATVVQMKAYWAMEDKLYFIICDLYAIHQKVLDTCQRSQAGTSSNGSTTSSWNINSYQSNSSIPMLRRPLADISLSTSDYTNNQNWNTGDNGFLSSHQERSRSIFTDPSDPSFAIPSFDIWLQQQQQQQQQQ